MKKRFLYGTSVFSIVFLLNCGLQKGKTPIKDRSSKILNSLDGESDGKIALWDSARGKQENSSTVVGRLAIKIEPIEAALSAKPIAELLEIKSTLTSAGSAVFVSNRDLKSGTLAANFDLSVSLLRREKEGANAASNEEETLA